ILYFPVANCHKQSYQHLTEPNSRYWAPPLTDSAYTQLVETLKKKQRIYPPLLSTQEKYLIDRVGTYDSNGYLNGIEWTISGHPIPTKTVSPGVIFIYDYINCHKYSRPSPLGYGEIELDSLPSTKKKIF